MTEIEPLLLSAAQTGSLLGVSRATVYSMQSSGALGPEPIRFGKRVLWRRADLEQWVRDGCPARDQYRPITNFRQQIIEKGSPCKKTK